MTQVSELSVKISADSAALTRGLADAKTSLGGFSDKMNATVTSVAASSLRIATSIAAIGAAAVAAGVAMGVAGVNIGKSLKDSADAAGFTATEYRALGDSAEEAGVNMEKLRKNLGQLDGNIRQAHDSSSATAKQFQELGINLKALERGDSAERLRVIADAIHDAGDSSKQADIAVAAFGASGLKMVQWLKQGRSGLDSAAEGFNKVHGSIGELEFEKLREGSNAIGDIKDVIDTLAMNIGVALTPAFKMAGKAAEDFISNKDGMKKFQDAIVSTVREVIRVGGNLAQTFIDVGLHVAELGLSTAIVMASIVKSIAPAGEAIFNFLVKPLKLATSYLDAFNKVQNANGLTAITDEMGDNVNRMTMFKKLADVAGPTKSGTDEIDRLKARNKVLAQSADALRDYAETNFSDPLEGMSFHIDPNALDPVIDGLKKIQGETQAAATAFSKAHQDGKAWGDGLVETFDNATKAIADNAQASVAADAEDESNKKKKFAADDAAAEKYYSTEASRLNDWLGVNTNVYAAAISADQQYWIAREASRDAALGKEKQALIDHGQAIQDQMDIESAYQEDNAQGKALREKSLNNTIGDFRVEHARNERETAGRSAAEFSADWEGKLNVTSNFLGQIAAVQNSKSRQMFEVGKAASIAQTLVNTYQSATGAFNAFVGTGAGPWAVAAGIAAASAAVVSGLANVQRISSTSFGGGGGGGGGGYGGANSGSGGPGASAPARENNVNVTLYGESYSAAQVRGLVGAINNAAGDNVNVMTRSG